MRALDLLPDARATRCCYLIFQVTAKDRRAVGEERRGQSGDHTHQRESNVRPGRGGNHSGCERVVEDLAGPFPDRLDVANEVSWARGREILPVRELREGGIA